MNSPVTRQQVGHTVGEEGEGVNYQLAVEVNDFEIPNDYVMVNHLRVSS